MPTLALLLAAPALAATVDRDLPDFQALCAESGVQVEVARADKAHVRLDVEGIDAEDVLTELDDGCMRIAPLHGKADTLELAAAAGASVDAERLRSRTAQAVAAAGATTSLRVTEHLEASAVAGGNIRYAGAPGTVDKDVVAGGSVMPIE